MAVTYHWRWHNIGKHFPFKIAPIKEFAPIGTKREIEIERYKVEFIKCQLMIEFYESKTDGSKVIYEIEMHSKRMEVMMQEHAEWLV